MSRSTTRRCDAVGCDHWLIEGSTHPAWVSVHGIGLEPKLSLGMIGTSRVDYDFCSLRCLKNTIDQAVGEAGSCR